MFSLLIFEDNNKKTPKPIIITPPTRLKPSINAPEELVKVLFMITPSVENTTEKPRTKNTVFKMILVLLTVIVCNPPLWFISLSVAPEI